MFMQDKSFMLIGGRDAGERGHWPRPFKRRKTGAEVLFHHSIIGNVMLVKDRIETNLSQLFEHPVTVFYNFCVYFWGHHCFWRATSTLVTTFPFCINFHCSQLLTAPPSCSTDAPTFLVACRLSVDQNQSHASFSARNFLPDLLVGNSHQKEEEASIWCSEISSDHVTKLTNIQVQTFGIKWTFPSGEGALCCCMKKDQGSCFDRLWGGIPFKRRSCSHFSMIFWICLF